VDLASVLAMILLFRGAKGGGGGGPAPSTAPTGPGPMPHDGTPPGATPAATPAVAPAAQAAAAATQAATAPAPSADTSTPASAPAPSLPWPQGPVPATLPPFPGPGWEPDVPVTPELAARATYWNGLLWDFPTKTQRRASVQENFGGHWLTFAAAWHPGDKGPKTYMATEAWRVKQAPAAVAPAVAPAPVPVTVQPSQAAAAAAAPAAAPAVVPVAVVWPKPIGPYPGTGAWQKNAGFIAAYQAVLAALGYVGADGHPIAADGKYGPNTDFAVKAFQGAHGVPVDGQVGPGTIPALNAALAAAQGAHAGT
jgi:hypothetical protein